jgi:hypothetical protein
MDLYRGIICDESIHFTQDDKLQILRILKQQCPDEIKKFSDGTRINLSKVSDSIVQSIYDLIKHRLANQPAGW